MVVVFGNFATQVNVKQGSSDVGGERTLLREAFDLTTLQYSRNSKQKIDRTPLDLWISSSNELNTNLTLKEHNRRSIELQFKFTF